MEEIKVGEYVRINGIIGKVEQIGNSLFWIEDGSSYSLNDKSINHSKNIIDLIEVGDVVNNHRVRKVYLDGPVKYIKLDNSHSIEDNFTGVRTYEDDIETILTHEQYERNCYKVKGE